MTSQTLRSTTRIAALVAALAAAVALSACSSPAAESSHYDHADPAHDATTLITAPLAGNNADDVAFATKMIPHHQQAIEMSALVPDRSTDPAVIALAKEISAAQGPEIDTLKVFLVQWNADSETSSGAGHGHGGMAMDGMLDDATMTKLESLKGTEFDELWLQSMIGHHQGAIEMAKAEVGKGENVDTVAMAKNIVATQQAEIDKMKQMSAATGG